MRQQGLFIDGAWRETAESHEVIDAWSGETVGRVSIASADDARAALDAAAVALAAGLPVPERSRVLARVAVLIADRAEELAQLITAETGKPITASRAEVARAVTTTQLSAEEAKRLPGERVPLDATAAGAETFAFTVPVARGVVAAITPFNFPLNLLMHKVGPALAAGCPVLVKPSDHARLTAGLLVSLFEEAGLAAGWIGLVTGPPEIVVGAWQNDDRVAVVTFTGSSKVGWSLKAASPRKLHVLELGSNTAMVVADDADLDRAVRSAADASLGNSGQACVSLQRVYVTAGAADAFIAKLSKLVSTVAFGDPRDEATVVGPLISTEARDRLASWIDEATASGSRALTGGTVVDGILTPTVLVDVPRDSPLLCEEAFGPVVTVVVVADLDEAIAEVNSADFALNTSIYTANLGAAMRYAERAEAGSVLVNMPPSFRADHMPYGGVKGSGQGLEGVKYAVAELLQEKLIVMHA